MDNPFATAAGAARYRAGRPFHHPRAVARIFAAFDDPSIEKALDIACGTGLSTVALADRVRFAVGMDSIEAMIKLALPTGAAYALGAAEYLPFRADTFELVTVSSGVHWFDQRAFFEEATRVLRPPGLLAVYDHFLLGSPDEPGIERWLEDVYSKRYPPPARGARADHETLAHEGFVLVEAFEYDDPIDFRHDELVAFLLSHSNTIAPASEGREAPEDTEAWLRTQTAVWFDPPTQRRLMFRAAGRCLRAGS